MWPLAHRVLCCSNFMKELAVPLEELQDFMRCNLPIAKPRLRLAEEEGAVDYRDDMAKKLHARLNDYFSKMSLEDQQQKTLAAAVQANRKVAFKAFTDNVLALVRDKVLKKYKEWIARIPDNDELRNATCERHDIVDRRRRARGVLQLMDDCDEELSSMHR